MDRKQSNALTGLKGLAILVIFLFHTLNIDHFGLPEAFSFLKAYGGYFGNYIFFMLSGFLISHTYRDRIRSGESSLGFFLGKRLIKLYPVYLLSNTIMHISMINKHGALILNVEQSILTALLQSGGTLYKQSPWNYPTWFVCVLFLCYILYYAITSLCKNHTRYVCGLILISIWGYILIKRNWNLPYCSMYCGQGFLNFFLGCLLKEIFELVRSRHRSRRVLCAAFQLAALLIFAVKTDFVTTAGDVRIVFSLMLCPALIYLVLESRLLNRIFSSKLMMCAGLLSSSVFFWHAVVYDICDPYYFETWGLTHRPAYLLYVGAVLIVSLLSYLLLEKKFTQFLQQKYAVALSAKKDV